MQIVKIIFVIILSILVVSLLSINASKNKTSTSSIISPSSQKTENKPELNLPLFIDSLRQRKYPASDIKIEETLSPGTYYSRYLASYQSDGLKIYGLFTLPATEKPKNGFPAIVFLHGYLRPKEYITTERYVAYQDFFARNGYITFKPDLRGHGKSEGESVNSNFSPDYVIDTLNLVSTFKAYSAIDPQRIGMWGHSNGGNLTLRSMVISPDIKVGVIWAGVVGDYEDLLNRYRNRIPWLNPNSPTTAPLSSSIQSFSELIKKYGTPEKSSPFWSKIEPYNYLSQISGPVQLHHGTADSSVPIELSRHLKDALEKEGKIVEYYEYEGGDHNIAEPNFTPAIQRSLDFFNKYL